MMRYTEGTMVRIITVPNKIPNPREMAIGIWIPPDENAELIFLLAYLTFEVRDHSLSASHFLIRTTNVQR